MIAAISKDVTLKTFTVKEVFEAIKKNGLGVVREEWVITDSDGNLVAACILGQGAYNLNAFPDQDSGYRFFDSSEVMAPYDYRWYDYTLEKQLNTFPVPDGKYGEYPPTDKAANHAPVKGLADAIVTWYDAYVFTGAINSEGGDEKKYLIPDEEVIPWVESLLKPWFDEEVTLATVDGGLHF